MILEYDARAIAPHQFRDGMLAHGTMVLRNAVPPEVIEPLGAAVEAMMDHYDAIPADVIRREMEHEGAARRGIWLEILEDGVHYNQDLVVHSQGLHTLFDPLRKSNLIDLVSRAWPEMEVRENFITNVRRLLPPGKPGYGDTPLASHIDAQFHQHELLGINFWTPLTNAGIEEPGLAVIPIGVEDTRRYLEYNPDGYERRPGDIGHMHQFRTEKLEPTALQQSGLANSIVRPKLRPGDVLAFTNFTIHATSVEPHMTKQRTSIEVRVLLLDRPKAPSPTSELDSVGESLTAG
jgi:hypothetical protein